MDPIADGPGSLTPVERGHLWAEGEATAALVALCRGPWPVTAGAVDAVLAVAPDLPD